MNKNTILKKTEEYVRKTLSDDSTGHDWWHVYRVWKNAINIGKYENADMFVVELAALLHDIADWKLYDGDENIGPKVASNWLKKLDVDNETISHVSEIIKNMSFKGANVPNSIRTIEGMIVQDADRLDAIGAIGIARTFAYGGHKKTPIYDPETKPEAHDSAEKYKNAKSPTINHFYEKLLLLKDLMNTETAKKIAESRHSYMEEFLNEFYTEWEGKDTVQ